MDKAILASKLHELLPEDAIFENEPMSAHTTFKAGGPVDFLVMPSTVDEIKASLQAARAANAPWYVIGCGSNLLVSDDGLRGMVIVLGEKFAQITIQDNILTAQAGATNKQVADAARDAGLTGYEFASGIPGSIGGAAIMNAGAYDGEFKDVGVSVTCLTLEGEVVEIPAEDARWTYRHSMMSDKGYIVLDATLHLVPFDKEKISERMADLKQRREDKQPLELGSAGSTFKRPVGYYAGKLIQDAGMQGHTVGGAQVSTKHAGFVVNKGGATAADIRQVIADVQNAVFADAGVHLETEVRMWGFDDED